MDQKNIFLASLVIETSVSGPSEEGAAGREGRRWRRE